VQNRGHALAPRDEKLGARKRFIEFYT